MADAPCCRDCVHFNGNFEACEYQPPISLVRALQLIGLDEYHPFVAYVPDPDLHHCSAFNPAGGEHG